MIAANELSVDWHEYRGTPSYRPREHRDTRRIQQAALDYLWQRDSATTAEIAQAIGAPILRVATVLGKRRTTFQSATVCRGAHRVPSLSWALHPSFYGLACQRSASAPLVFA